MPRISVNKLGEYLVTPSATRRRRILLDQKAPSKVVVPCYRLADEPLVEFFGGGGTAAPVDRAVVRLRSDLSGSDWAIKDRKNTAHALEAVLRLAPRLPFEGVSYVRGPDSPPLLHIKGVNVSVAPNLLLRFEHRGVPCVGALKFHFTKSDDSALEQEGAEYVATLLHHWLTQHGPHGLKPMPSHCYSVDVFRGAVVCAPTATARRMSNITAACEEIVSRWEQL